MEYFILYSSSTPHLKNMHVLCMYVIDSNQVHNARKNAIVKNYINLDYI